MNQKRNDGVLISMFALLVAAVITMAAAIGLSAAREDAGRRVMSINPNAQRNAVTSTGSTESSPRAAPIEEPALMQIDRAGEHHG